MTPLDQLDALCATEIMGFTKWQLPNSERHREDIALKPERWLYKGLDDDVENWQPTRNIAQAFEVLEKFIKEERCIAYDTNSDTWHCDLFDITYAGSHHDGVADTPALAIVKACLKANGVEIE